MKIKFIGTGGAFDVNYGNSSAIVDLKDKNILIDCGHAIFPALVKKNLVEDFDHILITHFHDDHVGSLSALILYRKMISGKKNLTILYPDEDFRDSLIRFLNFSLRNPLDYVHFEPLSAHEDIGFINTTGMHVEGMVTYSYFFTEKDKILVYSGDLGEGDLLFNHFKTKAESSHITFFHEVSFNENVPPHTFYKELDKYKKLGKIYGYHCDPEKKPDDLSFPLVAETPELLA